MITLKALHKAKVLAFREKHGHQIACEAFEVKSRTLYQWLDQFEQGGRKIEALNDKKRTPHTKRKRIWPEEIISELKRLRFSHPNLGKDKLYPLLLPFCDKLKLKCPKPRTIGRLIKDMGGLKMRPAKISHFGKLKVMNRRKVLRKPKDFKAEYPGHCVALDTIESHVWGRRHYVITFEDIFVRFGFAWETNSHASKAAAEFFELCLKVFPFPISFVLTDNGSEFMKEFDRTLRELHLTHYHTYPRTPKMNAHCERFNRTLQEEFMNYHTHLLSTPELFNQKLIDYLVFYNTERVHHAFGNKLSPVQFLLHLPQTVVAKMPTECKTGWPHTLNSQFCRFVIEYKSAQLWTLLYSMYPPTFYNIKDKIAQLVNEAKITFLPKSHPQGRPLKIDSIDRADSSPVPAYEHAGHEEIRLERL